MSDSQQPIVIAGGGIGGLATALGLAQKGFASIVLERSPELAEIGAGIQLGPNAFHAFDYLGVGDAARAMAVYIDKLRLMDAMSGDEIMHIPLDEAFRARFKNPYAVVHRADLHQVFLDACIAHDNVTLVNNVRVAGYENTANGAKVIAENGDVFEGDAVIGADGVRSVIRQQLCGGDELKLSGHVAYRAVLDIDDMPEDLRWNAATLWAGPKCHIVHYPLSDWKCFNLVVTYHNDAPEPVAGKPVPVEEVRRGFEHIHERPRQIIEKGQNWKLWVLCDRDPVQTWVDGRVALLGDAAHPMLQYFAQGACMAMEDAVCLSGEMERTGGDIERALPAYQEKRVVRTARVQLQSRWIGENIYHPAGAHAELRNTIMRAKTPDEWYDAVQWIYGGTGLAGGASAVC